MSTLAPVIFGHFIIVSTRIEKIILTFSTRNVKIVTRFLLIWKILRTVLLVPEFCIRTETFQNQLYFFYWNISKSDVKSQNLAFFKTIPSFQDTEVFFENIRTLLQSVSGFIFSKHCGYRSRGVRGVERLKILWEIQKYSLHGRPSSQNWVKSKTICHFFRNFCLFHLLVQIFFDHAQIFFDHLQIFLATFKKICKFKT